MEMTTTEAPTTNPAWAAAVTGECDTCTAPLWLARTGDYRDLQGGFHCAPGEHAELTVPARPANWADTAWQLPHLDHPRHTLGGETCDPFVGLEF